MTVSTFTRQLSLSWVCKTFKDIKHAQMIDPHSKPIAKDVFCEGQARLPTILIMQFTELIF